MRETIREGENFRKKNRKCKKVWVTARSIECLGEMTAERDNKGERGNKEERKRSISKNVP